MSELDLARRTHGPGAEIVVFGADSNLSSYLGPRQLEHVVVQPGSLRCAGPPSPANAPLTVLVRKGALVSGERTASSEYVRALDELVGRLGEDELAAGRRLIGELRRLRVGAYNFVQPPGWIDLVPPRVEGSQRILVLGRRERDDGVRRANLALLRSARVAHPDDQLVYKPHPADAWTSRVDPALRSLAPVLEVAVALPDVLHAFDRVCVSGGLAGIEALVHGAVVEVFGAPFYAGRGLTIDHVPAREDRPELSLEALALAVYERAPHCLEQPRRAMADSLLWLAAERSRMEARALLEAGPSSPRRCVAALRVGPEWRPAITAMFPELEIIYIERSGEKNIEDRLSTLKAENPNLAVLLWGYFQPRGFMDIVARLGLDVLRFEDGFLRSVGIGAEKDAWGNVNYPVSITLDARGIYYDRRQTSDAEQILSRYPFERDPVLLSRASACIEAMNRHGLTKYNVTERRPVTEVLPPRNGSGGRRRILVIGQVENDASIRYGCTRPAMATNNDLVRAAAHENPDAEILYKPHPVVLRGAAGLASDPAHVAGLCRILHEEVNLPDLLDHVDHVYVLTSGVGMEALIKGVPVTTFGTNIYAGWGLTDDRDPLPRRTRSLSVAELFAGFHLLHTRYFDHSEGRPMELEGAIEHLVRERGRQRGVEQATRGMQALARGEAGLARELLERAVTANPTILPWWKELGRAAELSGDFERAVDCADRVLARCPTSSSWHLIRARLGSRLGFSLGQIDTDLVHACRFAEADDPVPYLETLAHAYLSGGDWLPLVFPATVRAEDAVERAPEAVLIAACALVDVDRVDRAVALTSLVAEKHAGVHLPLRLRALRARAGDLTGPDEWAVELTDVLESTLADALPCSDEQDRLMVVDDSSVGGLSHDDIARSVYIGDRRLGSPPLVQVISRPLRANARTVVLSEDLIDRPFAGWLGLHHGLRAGCEARLVARELTRDLARRIGYWPGPTLLFAEWLAQGAGDLGRFDFSRVALSSRFWGASARERAQQERLAELTGISVVREGHAGQVA